MVYPCRWPSYIQQHAPLLVCISFRVENNPTFWNIITRLIQDMHACMQTTTEGQMVHPFYSILFCHKRFAFSRRLSVTHSLIHYVCFMNYYYLGGEIINFNRTEKKTRFLSFFQQDKFLEDQEMTNPKW